MTKHHQMLSKIIVHLETPNPGDTRPELTRGLLALLRGFEAGGIRELQNNIRANIYCGLTALKIVSETEEEGAKQFVRIMLESLENFMERETTYTQATPRRKGPTK